MAPEQPSAKLSVIKVWTAVNILPIISSALPFVKVLARYLNLVGVPEMEEGAVAFGSESGSIEGDYASFRFLDDGLFIRVPLRMLVNFDFGEEAYEVSMDGSTLEVDFSNGPYQYVDIDRDIEEWNLIVPNGTTRGSLIIKNTDSSVHTVAGPEDSNFFGGDDADFQVSADEEVHVTCVYLGSVKGWHINVVREA